MTATSQPKPKNRPSNGNHVYWNLGTVTRALLVMVAVLVGLVFLLKASILPCLLIWMTAAIMFSIERGLYLFGEQIKVMRVIGNELTLARIEKKSQKSNNA